MEPHGLGTCFLVVLGVRHPLALDATGEEPLKRIVL